MEIQIPGRRRRTHTESFKLAVTHACQVPGASVAGGALDHVRQCQSSASLDARTGCRVAIPTSGADGRCRTRFRSGSPATRTL